MSAAGSTALPSPRVCAPFRRGSLAGFRYIRMEPSIAMLFVLMISFSLLARPFTELFPALAGGSFGDGPQMLAMLMSAQGLGAFVGTSWMLRRHSTPALVRISYGAAFGIDLALIAFSFAGSAIFALPLIAIAGLLHVVCHIAMQSMAQSLSLPAMRGRVLALYTLIFRAAPALAGLFAIAGAAALPSARRIYFGERT